MFKTQALGFRVTWEGRLQQKAPIGKLCVMHIPLCSPALCDTQLHHIHEFVIPSENMRRRANLGVPGTLSFQC
jgi:hypothetical protein